MALTTEVENQIRTLRGAGIPYGKIASFLDLNANTVKTWSRRTGTSPDPDTDQVADPMGVWCRHCGSEIESERPAKFCSEQCRRTWWGRHPDLIDRSAFYEFTCAGCGQGFSAYGNNHRKYCSHPCYIRARFKTRGGNA